MNSAVREKHELLAELADVLKREREGMIAASARAKALEAALRKALSWAEMYAVAAECSGAKLSEDGPLCSDINQARKALGMPKFK